MTSSTLPNGRYLQVLNPAAARPSERPSAMPLSCAKKRRGEVRGRPTEEEWRMAERPGREREGREGKGRKQHQ